MQALEWREEGILDVMLPGVDVVEVLEVVGGMAGLGAAALTELEMQMMKNHLRNLLFLALRDLALIVREPSGARHLLLLVVFETKDQLRLKESQSRESQNLPYLLEQALARRKPYLCSSARRFG